jgi:predicted flap endonuclease-1-like 5' DNA nuclease
MSQSVILIVAAVLLVLLIVWIVRSRGNTAGKHIDTSVTAIGAATEAVEDIVEAVVHKAEEALKVETKAAGGESGDVEALTRTSAAIMASGGVATGAATLTEIGVPAAVGEPDNLRQLKGVGPKLATLLTQLGITRFDQVAAWGKAEIAAVDAHLGTFKGRITRDNWIEQAAFLAKGDIAGFEAKFGKLDSPGNN